MASTSRELAILDLIVHELRTPLSVAAGSLAQVSEGSAFTPAQQSAAERVERSLKTLTALTDQLRAWSRTSDTTPRPPVNLAAALAPALESADGRRRGIDLVRPEVPADIQIMSVGDLFIPALTSIVAAVVRSAPNRSTVRIQVTFDDREVRILVGERLLRERIGVSGGVRGRAWLLAAAGEGRDRNRGRADLVERPRRADRRDRRRDAARVSGAGSARLKPRPTYRPTVRASGRARTRRLHRWTRRSSRA